MGELIVPGYSPIQVKDISSILNLAVWIPRSEVQSYEGAEEYVFA